jgi:hypothetical protein
MTPLEGLLALQLHHVNIELSGAFMKIVTRLLFMASLFILAMVSVAEPLEKNRLAKSFVNGDLLVAAQGVNLRKDASLTAPIIRQADNLEVVMVEGAIIRDGFVSVRLADGKPAWVSAKYIKPLDDSVFDIETI